jgi:hypothetical protein
MEIGVYNAENARSMIKAAMKNFLSEEIEYYGFDFFHHYKTDNIKSKLNNLGCFYSLFKGNTLESIPKAIKSLPMMDIIFIDGGKSYKESSSDWRYSSMLMHETTGIFVHNVGFFGVGKMVLDISENIYDVQYLNPRYEGKVAFIKRRI